jgi:hypothetical protein
VEEYEHGGITLLMRSLCLVKRLHSFVTWILRWPSNWETPAHITGIKVRDGSSWLFLQLNHHYLWVTLAMLGLGGPFFSIVKGLVQCSSSKVQSQRKVHLGISHGDGGP